MRGTVRSLANRSKYEFLEKVSPLNSKNLEFFEVELTDKEKWVKATEGVDYILHIASPIPPNLVQNEEEEIIKPAVEGTLNVLEAALKSKVKKVVVTSSSVAVSIGGEHPADETSWVDSTYMTGYVKSKILAEKALWDFYGKHKGEIEIVAINPSFVLGPSLSENLSSSSLFIQSVLSGEFPGIPTPDSLYEAVDVRDVANAHILALFNPASNGKRYISSAAKI